MTVQADDQPVETSQPTVASSAEAARPVSQTSCQLHCPEQSMKLAQATQMTPFLHETRS
jgi:hypothetical protein